MPREMRLAARPHGSGPTYFNVTPPSSCSPIADNVRVGLQAGNAERGFMEESLVNIM